MKYLLIPICVFIFFQIHSQVLFEDGQSGFGLGAQFTSTNGSTLFGILPSYTITGRVNLGVTIGSESNDDLDLNSTAIRPNISYAAIRQGQNDMPINVVVTGAYQYNTFKDLDLTANTIFFGLSIIHQVKATKNLDIFPAGGVGWQKISFNLLGFEEDSSSILYGLSSSFLFSKKFSVTPSLSISEGESVFTLSVGLLFPN